VIITSKSPDFSKQSTGHENDGEIGREDALGQVSRMFVTINGWRIYCEREERGPTRRVGLSDSDIVVSVEKVE
jgi:hypothetical protein